MAKSQYTYTHSVTDKLSVKGELSEDGKTVTYLDEDKEERSIKVEDCFKKFADQYISFSITTSKDEDNTDTQ